jgi:hypothetical protein
MPLSPAPVLAVSIFNNIINGTEGIEISVNTEVPNT